MQLLLVKFLSEFATKAVGFGQHADQSALHRFRGAADKFRLGLNFTAALRGSFGERGPQHRLVHAQF